MNIQKLFWVLIIFNLVFIPISSFGEDYCSQIKKDYFDLKDILKKPIDKTPDKKNIDLNIANKLLYDYKMDELDKYIGDYSGSNVALNLISAKVNIYTGKYQKAMDKFNDILDKYPMHPEVIYLKNKLLDLLLNNCKSNMESAIIYRELGFPDKSLDILKSLVVNDSSNNMWYEIAKSLLFYLDITQKKLYPYPDDVIAKAMKGKLKSKNPNDFKPPLEKNDNFRYVYQICEYIALNSTPWDEVLDENDKQTMKDMLDYHYKTLKKINLSNDSHDDLDYINSVNSINLLTSLINILCGYYQDYYDKKNNREYVSSIYVMKTDLGPGYYDIFRIAKDCKFDKITESYGKNNVAKCIKTDFTYSTKMNLTDLFLITQQNYLGIKSWNGPYLIIPIDNSFGYDYIYSENHDKNSYGVMSSGPDHNIDNFDVIQGDDKGLFISCSTVEK